MTIDLPTGENPEELAAQDRAVIKYRAAGMTLAQIGRAIGRNSRTVSNIIRRLGLTGKKMYEDIDQDNWSAEKIRRWSLKIDKRAEAYRRFCIGESTDTVAKALQICDKTAAKWRREMPTDWGGIDQCEEH